MDVKLELLSKLVKALQADGSSKYKKAVLKGYGEHVKDALATIYDPMKPFHITSKGLASHGWVAVKFGLSYLLFTLSNPHIEACHRKHACEIFIGQNKDKEELIRNIIDKDLKCGISIKTLNAVWPGLIYNFKSHVPLANKYREGMCDFDKDNWYVSRKLDGVRCLGFIENNKITFYSRNGKVFTTLGKLEDDIFDHMPIGLSLVLDGELCIADEDGNEDFASIMKQIRRKNHTIENIKFFTFDYYTPEEFRKGVPSGEYYNTYWVHDCKLVEMLEHSPINQAHPLYVYENCMPDHWEGLMLRQAGTVFKRSNNLLKLKRFLEADYRVIGVTKGSKYIQGEENPCVASLVVQHRGFKVYVGSGLSDNERLDFYQNENRIIGKTITVQYFEETKDSLRFPTYKGIRDYE